MARHRDDAAREMVLAVDLDAQWMASGGGRGASPSRHDGTQDAAKMYRCLPSWRGCQQWPYYVHLVEMIKPIGGSRRLTWMRDWVFDGELVDCEEIR